MSSPSFFRISGRLGLVLPVSAAVLSLACNKTPEPEPTKDPAASSSSAQAAAPPSNTSTTETSASKQKPTSDPLNGKFSLADATKNITGSGALVATIDTSDGVIRCKLLEDKAPNTVANFVGLATGTRTWKDPRSGEWGNKPAFDGTTFHRIIKGFMIQGGDAAGDGTGEPGYVIPDELWAGAKHDKAGLLCMANRGHNTNGAQFFVTDDAAAHLDNNYTIFGDCTNADSVGVVHKIAAVKVGRNDKPETPVNINSVKIAREKPGAAGKSDTAKK